MHVHIIKFCQRYGPACSTNLVLSRWNSPNVLALLKSKTVSEWVCMHCVCECASVYVISTCGCKSIPLGGCHSALFIFYNKTKFTNYSSKYITWLIIISYWPWQTYYCLVYLQLTWDLMIVYMYRQWKYSIIILLTTTNLLLLGVPSVDLRPNDSIQWNYSNTKEASGTDLLIM